MFALNSIMITKYSFYFVLIIYSSLDIKAPIIINPINCEIGISDITFKVLLNSRAVYAGNVWCIALIRSTNLSSISQIILNGIFQPYRVGDSSVQVIVRSLKALTEYDTYCYVKNIENQGNSLEEIKHTKKMIKTKCCKLISYINAPTSIYAELEKYNNAASSQYLYVFSLSAAPSYGTLVVTPVFFSTNQSKLDYNNTIFSPSNLSFVPSSTFLQGAFTIDSTAGTYKLDLSLSGFSSLEYITPSVRISITEIVYSPKMISAKFSNNGASVYTTFNSPTNMAHGDYQSWKCSLLFDFDGVKQSSCIWLSNIQVQIMFGSFSLNDRLLSPNGEIVLLGGKIPALCSKENNRICIDNNQTTIVKRPDQPVVPNIIISVLKKIPSCINVTIDASLSSGDCSRDWISVVWNVTADNADAPISKIRSYLNSYCLNISLPLKIPKVFVENNKEVILLQAGTTYTITLIVENFLNQRSSTNAIFSIVDDSNTPLFNILGPKKFRTNVFDQLVINTAINRCGLADRFRVSYEWFIENADNDLVEFSADDDSQSLYLEAYSLTGGVTYTITATVTSFLSSLSSPITTVSDSIQVTILKGPIIALISQGHKITVPPMKAFILDASLSQDKNILVTKLTDLTFKWSCMIVTPSLYGQVCNFRLNFPQPYECQFDGELLLPDYTYKVVLIVSAKDGRFDRITIDLEAGDKSLNVYSTSNGGTTTASKINPNTRLTINGVLQQVSKTNEQYNASWMTIVNGVYKSILTSTPQQTLITFKYNENFKVRNYLSSSQIVYFPIVVEQGVLLPGFTVTFQLRISKVDAVHVESCSEVTVIVSQPPTGGLFYVNPLIGDSYLTPFTMSMVRFTGDIPLSFSFSYQIGVLSNILSIQKQTASNIANTQLPPSYQELKLYGIVYDVIGSTTIMTESVNVTEQKIDYFQYLNSSLSKLEGLEDYRQTITIVNTVSTSISIANCSSISAKECDSLNRQQCLYTPGTCSGCKDGFVGIVGDSNLKCIRQSSAFTGLIGDECNSDDDCIFQRCQDKICIDVSKTCPSSTHEVCSGHGKCIYNSLTSSISVSQCTESDTQCVSQCKCHDNYGDKACSLDMESLKKTDKTINLMCSTFNKYLKKFRDKNGLDYDTSTLDTLYTPDKVIYPETNLECKITMRYVNYNIFTTCLFVLVLMIN